MGLFKSKSEDQWKINYIKEFNEMRDNYEDKLKMKQMEIDNLKKEIEHLKSLRNNDTKELLNAMNEENNVGENSPLRSTSSKNDKFDIPHIIKYITFK